MIDFRYQLANANDASAIFIVLEEIAAEIPVLLDIPDRKEKEFKHIQTCCGSGESWIALDRDTKIVGFLLAEPDQMERFHYDNHALHLPYGGISRSHRGHGVFPTLAGKIIEKRVPVTATVKRANKSGMVGRLMKLGFAKIASTGDQDNLRWQPGREDVTVYP